MQRTIVLTLTLLLLLTFGVRAETQYQMNMNSAKEFEKADKELNSVYKQLMDKLDNDGRQSLIASQKAWVSYRDADSSFQSFPNKGGTIYAMAYTQAETVHTKDRIAALKQFMQDMAAK
jgi:uncharacterized protein YecT (DUF1311 family)